jgi:archaellum component FlaF (FlaF/FlaG flagellin family)
MRSPTCLYVPLSIMEREETPVARKRLYKHVYNARNTYVAIVLLNKVSSVSPYRITIYFIYIKVKETVEGCVLFL